MRSIFTRKPLRSTLASICLLFAVGCGEGVDDRDDREEEAPVEEAGHGTDPEARLTFGERSYRR